MKRLLAALVAGSLAFSLAACDKKGPGTGGTAAASASPTVKAGPDVNGTSNAVPSPGQNDHNGTECLLNYLPDGSTGLSVVPGVGGTKVILGTVSITCNPPPTRHRLILAIYKRGEPYHPVLIAQATYDSRASRDNLPSPTIIKSVSAPCSPGVYFLTAIENGSGPAPQYAPLFSSGAGYAKRLTCG